MKNLLQDNFPPVQLVVDLQVEILDKAEVKVDAFLVYAKYVFMGGFGLYVYRVYKLPAALADLLSCVSGVPLRSVRLILYVSSAEPLSHSLPAR